MTTDLDVVDLPGWDELVRAGAVASPPPEVVERARRQVAAAARQAQPSAVIVGTSRWRRPVAIAAAVAAAAAAVAVGVVSLNGEEPTVVLASDGTAGPALVVDSDLDCHTGGNRVADPAATAATLGYLPADPTYTLTSLYVRELRWNCPAYSASLALVAVAADGRVDRYVTVYGPMVAVPWVDPDETGAAVSSTTVQGHAAQFLDHSDPVWGASHQAIWTDAEGRGWTADTGGLDATEVEEVLEALVLGADGAQVAGSELFGMTATSYENQAPVHHWQPSWGFEYRTSSGDTISVDTTNEGAQETTAPSLTGIADLRRVTVRDGKAAWLRVDDYSQTGGGHELIVKWREGPETWVSASTHSDEVAAAEATLLHFVESLAPAAPDDPRLDLAQ